MPSSSGTELEENDRAHFACLMYKLVLSSRHSDDKPIDLLRSINAWERKMTNIETSNGKYHVKIYWKDIFGFAEHQGNATYGLG